MKGIVILGSTGSIGCQALNVIKELGSEYNVLGLAAGLNKKLALQQVKTFNPAVVSLANKEDADWLRDNLNSGDNTKVVYGYEGLIAAATWEDADIVLTSVSGAVGLTPSIEALRAGKDLALANKETLVAAGELVTDLAQENGRRIMPVDSEHSAIWQCLWGEDEHEVEKIILTASGGPFREKSMDYLFKAAPENALKHPNWDMGAKITIDSATLMNKGLEVIEARWLFGVDYDNIEVLIHPQSIIHSMVEFIDGSIKAQIGVPDMSLPIQGALTYPHRVKGLAPRLSRPIRDLTFESPDLERFPCLRMAYEAGKAGGTMPAVLNAVNEVVVRGYLNKEVGLMDVPKIIEKIMHRHAIVLKPALEDILMVDEWARKEAQQYLHY
ncbi:MAG: 1-deoxy-D-xylulose-5-phosphate reductoisomerase [Clostridiales bacterium]|nr:1-deoxy-D-xylulose-5-phosphate reductoisomerase [Clostridiales bacterium]MCF8022173.1 1-deoxy-D-xylulose-5-phosphate reductoisomerase [Clostridiales bacterium]